MWKKCSTPLISLALLLAVSSASFASGFALIEQSVSGLGNAFAGGAASAEDATTVFYNPAGMSRIQDTEALAAFHVIVPSAKFTNQNSTHATTLPLTGNDGGDGADAAIVPNLYIVKPISDKATFGLGINSPFGLVTEYNETWVGRYHALKSDLMSININPSMSWKITDKLSIGAGLSAMYIDANLSQMVDFGLIAYSFSSGALGVPQAQDGKADLNADDWAYGYNIGALYEFDQNTRVGFAYRSKVHAKLEGSADFTIPTSVSTLPAGVGAGISAAFADTGVTGKITLPATASLSIYSKVTDNLALMADVTWTEWSSFQELVFDFANPLATDSVTPEKWDDTWRYSAGVSYDYNDSLVLRGGLAFDETPMKDNYRTPRIPGNDRFWISGGAGYKYSDNLTVDFAYAHLFVKDATINLVSAENTAKGYLTGSFENSVDIASIQLSYKF